MGRHSFGSRLEVAPRNCWQLLRKRPRIRVMLSTIGANSDVSTAAFTSAPGRVIRLLLILGFSAFLTSGTPSRGQDSSPSAKPGGIEAQGPIEVLSDTKGFNMKPYLRGIATRVKATWFTLVPNSARAPILARGHLAIDFRLMKDGHVKDIKYHETSGNVGFDRAAYGAIVSSSPMPPLPEDFQCQFVKMRFHFYYNESPSDIKERSLDDQVLPCVTSKVIPAAEGAPSEATATGNIPLVVSPGTIQLAPGAQVKFVAKIYGLVNSAVTWSVQGSGCERSACGVVSSDGRYIRPDKIPDPPAITVIATSTVTPSQTASSTVTIAVPGDAH